MSDLTATVSCSIGDIFTRVTDVIGEQTDAAIAKCLGVTPQAIANARKRGTMPYEKLIVFAQSNNLSLDYLLLGKELNDTKNSIDPDLLAEIFHEIGMKTLSDDETRAKLHARKIGLIYNRIIKEIGAGWDRYDSISQNVQLAVQLVRGSEEGERLMREYFRSKLVDSE